MPQDLPARPDIEWLKKAAKDVLANLKKTDPAARLHQAQHALAQDHGFASWRALKAHVDGLSVEGQLLRAARGGDAKALAALLAAHPDKLGVMDGANKPLLHVAAENGHLESVEVLLKAGFDVGARDRMDQATALHWAAQQGQAAVVERLIAAGSDVNDAADAHEIGPIGWATCFQVVRQDMADLLMRHGARPSIFSAAALGRDDAVREVAAADPAAITRTMSRYDQSRTALHLAVMKNRPAVVRALLELGADPQARDARGRTPGDLATRRTDPAILQALGGVATRRPVRFEGVTPILAVKSLPAAVDYYVRKLGFLKEWDYGDPPTFACVYRDGVFIFLSQGGQGSPGTWLSIFVQDVDALYEEYQRSGALIREAPSDHPWGVREMIVEDLDQHRLRLGTSTD
jgi:ankyrin repeat protein/catechol 2,3-dioxygenase-like lactoylglutathione lyase family enzyme